MRGPCRHGLPRGDVRSRSCSEIKYSYSDQRFHLDPFHPASRPASCLEAFFSFSVFGHTPGDHLTVYIRRKLVDTWEVHHKVRSPNRCLQLLPRLISSYPPHRRFQSRYLSLHLNATPGQWPLLVYPVLHGPRRSRRAGRSRSIWRRIRTGRRMLTP